MKAKIGGQTTTTTKINMKFLYQLNNYLRDLAPLSTIEKNVFSLPWHLLLVK